MKKGYRNSYKITKVLGKKVVQAILKMHPENKQIEQALLGSFEKLKTIFEEANDGILAIDIKTKRFGFANPMICEITGYSIKELLKLDLTKIHPKKYLTYIISQYAKQMKGRKTFLKNIPILRKDKKVVYCDVNSRIIKIREKEYLVSFFKDITSRKRAEEKLKISEERFKSVVESAGEWIWEVNNDGLYTYSSRVVEKILGYKPEELVGKKHFYDFFTNDVKDELKKGAFDIFAKKESFTNFVNANIHKSGNIVILQTRGVPILNKKGALLGYRGADTDITEQKRADKELKESESRYRLLAENATDVIWTTDLELNFNYISPSVEHLLGYTMEEALALGIENTLTPGSYEMAMKVLEEEMDLENLEEKDLARSRILELELNRKDGSTIWTEATMRFLRDQNDQPTGIQGIARDISDRKRAEGALRANEGKYRSLFEKSTASITLVDESGVVIDCNRATEEITGYSKNEIIGESFEKLITLDPKDLPTLMELYENLLTGQDIKPHELEIINKDAERRWINIFVSKLFKGKDIVGFQIIASDITERKHAEEALRESEGKFRELANLLPQIVFEIDLEGNFTFANRYGLESCGYSQKDIDEGLNALQLFIQEELDRVADNIQRIMGGEQFENHEYTILRKDGSTFPALIYSSSIIRDGKSVGLRGIVLDITDRKRAEEKLKKTLSELERSNKELEHFAYIASHDLKEPLRMISSYVQLLERRYKGKLDADADEYISYAVDGAKRMQNLINDLLSYSRVSTRGKDFERTNIEEVLNNALSNLGLMVEDNGAVVTHDSLPLLKADDVQLIQLFQNLVGNAIKFRGANPPKVHFSAKKSQNEWLFSIEDNGIGIESKYAERAFLIFQRLHHKDEYPGTGIGLAVCKRIIERHNGRIWFESEPGRGTTFYFTIPILEGELKC